MPDEIPPRAEPPWIKRRTLGQWTLLLAVWTAGLVVWSIYLIAIIYLFFKVFV